jgi:predicted transcriptional regulator
MILRNSHKIIAEILECAQAGQGVKKTRVIYEVQITFAQVQEYLKYLQQRELISYDKENRVFRTTLKGKKFLKLYNEMNELTSEHRSE